jgi:hypothetical protein
MKWKCCECVDEKRMFLNIFYKKKLDVNHEQKMGSQFLLMSEKNKTLLCCYQMRLLKCLKPMHTFIQHIILYMELFICNIIMLMKMKK